MSFNPSGKKEDLSTKLRTHNVHSAREQTKQLEQESRKMEERLQELKLAMNRDREERERAQGQGGFWKAGQTGTMGGYAKDVLNKYDKSGKPAQPKEKKSKKMTVKVLKDEPIVTADRPQGPGTMAFIARKGAGSRGKENLGKAFRCGQCEEKGAQVSCVECGEDYCAACYASFHLKGALRKHRSVPLGSGGSRTPRGFVTPRGSQSLTNGTGDGSGSSGHPANPMKITASDIDISFAASAAREASESGASQPPAEENSNSLKDGAYNEADSAAEFQAALRAWRHDPEEQTAALGAATSQKATSSPTKSQGVGTDSSTSTDSGQQVANEIHFSQSLSYAEKLLLKRHRRMELKPLPDEIVQHRTESAASAGESDSYSNTHREGWRSPDTYTDQLLVPAERSESRVSIIELGDPLNKSVRRMEQSTSYQVDEVAEDEQERRLRTGPPTQRKQAFMSPTPPRSTRSSRGRRSPQVVQKKESDVVRDPVREISPSRRTKSGVRLSRDLQSQDKVKGQADDTTGRLASKEAPATTMVKSGASRPASRAKSRSEVKPRPTSRTGKRPESRAKSRAQSRMEIFGEGVLTKAPTDAVRELAQMAGSLTPVGYSSGLDELFMVGVAPSGEAQERVMTPSRHRGAKDDKWRVSNRLYQMAPRSWRPDSSLGAAVTDTEVTTHLQDVGIRHQRLFEAETSVAPGNGLSNEELKLTWSMNESLATEPLGAAALRKSIPEPLPTRGEPQFHSARSRGASQGVGRSSGRCVPGVRPPMMPPSRSEEGSTPRTSRQSLSTPTPRPSTRAESRSGRESVAVVMDGEDLSVYDSLDDERQQNQEDRDTLEQLQWELASESGTVTADGKMSSLGILGLDPEDDSDEAELGINYNDGRASGLTTPSQSMDASAGATAAAGPTTPHQSAGATNFDIQNHLRASELMADFEEMEQLILAEDENEVKALH